MYDVGSYRIAVIPFRIIQGEDLLIKPEPDGNEYRPDGHVNVIEAKQKALVLASKAYVLNRDETITGFHPPVDNISDIITTDSPTSTSDTSDISSSVVPSGQTHLKL